MKEAPAVQLPKQIASKYIEVEGLKLHYLEAGDKEVILMLHGYPTSAYLWRNLMPKLAETHRVIALDLPGYGQSAKPLDGSYSFFYYEKILTAFLAKLEIEQVHLMVHDLGGPIGLFWAVRQSERLSSLILLNTLVYPKFSWGVILFTAAFRLPFTQDYLTSARGIKTALRIGVQNSERIQGELLETYQKPFRTKAERQALKKSATRLSIKGFKEIAKKLPSLKVPVRAIYGTNDWALPKVAQTMELVKKDLPQTEITALSNCGHFLQEDEPELVAGLVSEFLNKI